MQPTLQEILRSYDDLSPLEEAYTIPASWYVDERIAELERLVGRLTMQLEIAKKASTLLGAQPNRNDR